MNANRPTAQNSDEERDALLTAYGLGELDTDAREAVEQTLAGADGENPRRIVAQTRSIGDVLREMRRSEVHGRSGDLRRAVVAALAQGKTRPHMKPPAWLRSLFVAAGTLAATVLVAATVFMAPTAPSPRAPTSPSPRVPTSPSPRAPAAPDAPAEMAPMGAARQRLARQRLAAPGAAGRSDLSSDRMPMAKAQAQMSDIEESAGRERYNHFEEHRSQSPKEQPLSTFSIDVDTASYAIVRRFLMSGRVPPRDAVRIEEMVNYFHYDYPQPKDDEPFSVALESSACPWRPGRLIVRIGIRGRDIDRAARPAGNLVFLVDVSGSMQQPDKLPLVKQALGMLVEELTENDRVSIVTYAGDAGLVLPPTTGNQKQRILAAIESLAAGGSTHGSAGINLAYEQAAEHFIRGGSNRVILATDGDLNVGVTSDQGLVDLIKQKAAGGTFLTVLGFGQGNLQDEKMEKLADHGNGVYAYIDGVREARKVLVEQLTGSTITIAKDVKIQVEFNPAQVASYRLLGYENRAMAAEDFRNDRKDAGDIGAGHTVTAVYEIVPVAGDETVGDVGAEPLKYQQQPVAEAVKPEARAASAELLTVKLRYKKPDGDTSILSEYPLAERGGSFDAASADLRFAAAVAEFGMILRGSEQAGNASLDQAAAIAGRSLGADRGGYRAEFIDLVRRAASLSRRGIEPR